MTGPRANRLRHESRPAAALPSPSPLPRAAVRPPVARNFMLCAVSVALIGCGSGDTSMPRDWRPLRLGATSGCPPVSGTYGAESELLFTTLIGQHLPSVARAIAWSAFSLHGNADTALTAIVMHAPDVAYTVRLRRDVAYRCIDGWLVPTVSAALRSVEGTPRAAAREVVVASAKDGALVARLRTTRHRELPVWCGDGCRGVRVPFSATTRVRWERAAPVQGDVADIEAADARQPLDARATRETRAVRRIRDALPPSVSMTNVTPHADGWHVTIDVLDRAILVPLLKTLSDTPGLADARVERQYESLNLEGSWREVIWLRVTSR